MLAGVGEAAVSLDGSNVKLKLSSNTWPSCATTRYLTVTRPNSALFNNLEVTDMPVIVATGSFKRIPDASSTSIKFTSPAENVCNSSAKSSFISIGHSVITLPTAGVLETNEVWAKAVGPNPIPKIARNIETTEIRIFCMPKP